MARVGAARRRPFLGHAWGCRCRVEGVSERRLRRLGKTGPDEAPPENLRQVVVGRGGDARKVEVPAGVDPGFGYRVGDTRDDIARAVRLRLEKAGGQAPELAARGVAELWDREGVLAAHTEAFAAWRRAQPSAAAPDPTPVGALAPTVLAGLRRLGHAPSTVLVTAGRGDLAHALRPKKAEWGQDVSESDIDRLPSVLARPRAVLYDTAGSGPSLLYVFGGGARRGKFVVRVRRASDRAADTNRVATAEYVDSASLRGGQYRLLDGSLDDE